jgi:hypothetical protein
LEDDMGRASSFVVSTVLLAGAIAVAAPPPAGSSGLPRVAVIPVIAVNLEAARVDAISQDLAQSLSSTLMVDATGGLDVRRELPPEGLPADCVSTPACIADVAKRTSSPQLLFIVMVGGAGGSVQIDATWIDASTGRRESRPAIDLTSSNDSDAKTKFDTGAQALLPDVAVRPRPVVTGRLALDTTMTAGTPRHFTTPAIATAVAAGVGLAAGVGFGLETRGKYNSCESAPGACSTSDRDTIRHYGLGADIGFGVAVGAAIATVALFATSGESPHVVVSPTAEGVSASWIGRF